MANQKNKIKSRDIVILDNKIKFKGFTATEINLIRKGNFYRIIYMLRKHPLSTIKLILNLMMKRSHFTYLCSKKNLLKNLFANASFKFIKKDKKLVVKFNEADSLYSFLWFYLFIEEVFTRDQYYIDFYKHFLRNNEVIDVGANMGVTTIKFFLSGASKVYAFEPLKKNYDFIHKKILSENKLSKKIEIFNFAVGEKRSRGKIFYSNFNDIAATLDVNRIELPQKNIEQTEIFPLDSIPKLKKKKIVFIKIDVEGFEKKVLEGAKQIIKSKKPIIVMAAYHHKKDIRDLSHYIKQVAPDYSIYLIPGTQLLCLPRNLIKKRKLKIPQNIIRRLA